MFCWCKSITLYFFNDLVPFFTRGRFLQWPFQVSKNRFIFNCSRRYNSGQFYHKYGKHLLLEIEETVMINRGSSHNNKSGQNYYKSEELQTIIVWERFIRNQGSHCKSGHLLKIDAQQYCTKWSFCYWVIRLMWCSKEFPKT